jgi:hypothetical protein
MLENPYTIKYIFVYNIYTHERTTFSKSSEETNTLVYRAGGRTAFTLTVFASFAERGTLPIAEPCAQWGSNKRNCDIQDG